MKNQAIFILLLLLNLWVVPGKGSTSTVITVNEIEAQLLVFKWLREDPKSLERKAIWYNDWQDLLSQGRALCRGPSFSKLEKTKSQFRLNSMELGVTKELIHALCILSEIKL